MLYMTIKIAAVFMAMLSEIAAEQSSLAFFSECECFQLKHGLTCNNLGASG
jgi:hypothetical protein